MKTFFIFLMTDKLKKFPPSLTYPSNIEILLINRKKCTSPRVFQEPTTQEYMQYICFLFPMRIFGESSVSYPPDTSSYTKTTLEIQS